MNGRLLAIALFAGSAPMETAADVLLPCTTMPEGVEKHVCSCPAAPERGPIWGSGPYTANSDICTAAAHAGAHAGALGEEGGAIAVLRAPGLDAYQGSSANGVGSLAFGPFGSSITFSGNR